MELLQARPAGRLRDAGRRPDQAAQGPAPRARASAPTPTRSSGGIRLWDEPATRRYRAGPASPARGASRYAVAAPAGGRESRRRRRVLSRPMATRLYLVRHGATQLTAEDRFSGAVGRGPLGRGSRPGAPPGRAPRRTTRSRAVYCSPLSRTVETADILAKPHGLTPVQRDGLREISHGRWEGPDPPRGGGALPRRVRGLGGRPLHLRARWTASPAWRCSRARSPWSARSWSPIPASASSWSRTRPPCG